MAVWRKLALLTFCVFGVCLCLATSPVPPVSNNPALSTDTLPIAVRNSETSFDLPTTSSQDQYLVVVSSLSREPGPFQVQVTTEPVSQPQPIEPARTQPDVSWSRRVDECRRVLRLSRQVIEPAEARTPASKPAAARTFWVMVRGNDFTQAKNYQAVQSRLWFEGDYCAVYVDNACTRSDRLDQLARLAQETFDRAVYPTAQRLLGRHRDVDGDGRFAILLTPWLSRLADGTVSLGGFVRGSDFYNDVEPPLGNRCDMMYLNADLGPGPHVLTLIAHEYTHAVTLCEHVFNRYLPDRLGQEEESWLDESIAHLAENLHNYSWSNLDYRISAFLSDPERYRLVVEDYYAAGIWRGHGNRGSTYLFLRWCVDQYGEEILRDLVQTNCFGVDNVEVTLARPFQELYRDWSVALFLSNTGLDMRPQDRLRFVNTRDELNGRLLAGPRNDTIRLDGDSRRFDLVGTSTKYLVAHSPDKSASASRVHIRSDVDAELQVSVRRLPPDLARLEVHATPADASIDAGKAGGIQLRIQECNGSPVRLERMAWERSTRGTNQDADRGYFSPVLNEPQIEQLFGSTFVPASGSLMADRVELGCTIPSDEPVLLKITARDEAGHTVSAWCPLQVTPQRLERTASGAESTTR